MSWLNCCIARGEVVSGGEKERDWLIAPGGEVPQTQRELISFLLRPGGQPWATHFWQQLLLISVLILSVLSHLRRAG